MTTKKERALSSGQRAFRTARARGVPLVALESADPGASIQKCITGLNGKGDHTPLIQWDLIRGARGLNTRGESVLANFTDDNLNDPTSMLTAFVSKANDLRIPHSEDPDRRVGAIIFAVHFNRFLEETGVMQALWNARDEFEAAGVLFCLLGPAFRLPSELKNDLITITEPLPSPDELEDILDKLADDGGIAPEKIAGREAVIDTMRGTSAFGARQALAMSFTKDGIDQGLLWDRKRKLVEQTPGLKLWRGGETFDQLGGLAAIKEFMGRILMSGKTPVRLVVYLDEIEKQMAGIAGDLSGTSGDQFGAILSYTQDNSVAILLLVGPPGTGKSAIAKACGGVAGAPVLAMDLGAMKGSLVGQSEQQIRGALQVASAVSDGKMIMVATCNRLTSLPPELKRRCTLGTWIVDLPDSEERKAIWPIWLSKYDLDKRQALPDCDGWSGAEIRACCDVAYRTGLTLREASKYVIPVIKSAPEQVLELRKLANNRFLSASKPGLYQYSEINQSTGTAPGRKMEL